MGRLWSSKLRYGLLLVRIQGENDLVETVRLGKKASLRCIDGQVISRDSHLGRWNEESSQT